MQTWANFFPVSGSLIKAVELKLPSGIILHNKNTHKLLFEAGWTFYIMHTNDETDFLSPLVTNIMYSNKGDLILLLFVASGRFGNPGDNNL